MQALCRNAIDDRAAAEYKIGYTSHGSKHYQAADAYVKCVMFRHIKKPLPLM
jgi:hypothetical protein